ncbi:MAG: muconolactone Delta-isomerase [Rhodospirillales bacterium]|nr:muconolactone Delta-isomerase [Rhodospirillales bacterium]
MLYCVEMEVRLPANMPSETTEKIKADEKAYAVSLQEKGKWVHLWRIVGRYANISVFDVESHDELHGLLSSLPLFPYMDIRVTPLARHPSAITR